MKSEAPGFFKLFLCTFFFSGLEIPVAWRLTGRPSQANGVGEKHR